MLTSAGSVSKLALPGIDPFTNIVESAAPRSAYTVLSSNQTEELMWIPHLHPAYFILHIIWFWHWLIWSPQLRRKKKKKKKRYSLDVDCSSCSVDVPLGNSLICLLRFTPLMHCFALDADSINHSIQTLTSAGSVSKLAYLELIHLLILWKVQIYVCAHTVLSSNQTEESMLLILSIQYPNAYLSRFRIQTCLPGIDPFTNGGTTASLMGSYSILDESNGVVNVADSINHSIQMPIPAGSVSILA
jgi:hypothetical protein